MKQLLWITGLSAFLFACTQKPATFPATNLAVQLDEQPGECPYLTKDGKGLTVLSWVRMLNDTTTAFCYAKSSDGKSFSAPVVIPNSGNIQPHGENLPKILFKPSGEIIALWGTRSTSTRNKYAGMVSYTQSFDEGKTWTAVKPLVTDTASNDQRYYDVAMLPNGEAAIIWLDNRKTTQKVGSALYFASTQGKSGFGEGHLISEPCCQCCRTDMFVDSKGGVHALFRGILQDSIRDMVHIVSADGGQTFSAQKRISTDNWVLNACPHTGPAMTENGDGLHFAWFTGAGGAGCRYTKSTDNGGSFVMQDSVSAKGSHPQLASLSSGELLIVWDESVVANGKVAKRIGVQRRTADGKTVGKAYITPDGEEASYPVIAAVGNRSSVVAYTKSVGGKNFVTFQVVDLNEALPAFAATASLR